MRTSLLLALFAASAATPALPAQDMIGVTWTGDAYGMWSTGIGPPQLIGPTGYSNLDSMAKAPDGTLYAMQSSLSPVIPSVLIRIDPVTGAGSFVSYVDLTGPRAMAFSTDGTLYVSVEDAAYAGGGRRDLWVVDVATGATSYRGWDGGSNLEGMIWTGGTLYAWSTRPLSGCTFGFGLVTVDPANGDVSDFSLWEDQPCGNVSAMTVGPDGVPYCLGKALYSTELARGDVTQIGNVHGVDIRGAEFLELGPRLIRTGTCPGPITLTVEGASPNRTIAFLYGQPGWWAKFDQPCQNLHLDMDYTPTLGALLTASAAGTVSVSFQAPAALCGLTVQAVDTYLCHRTNPVTL